MIHAVLRKLKPIATDRRYVFAVISLAVALLALVPAWILSPWFYSMNTSVRLYLDAPAETKLSICWDSSLSQCLPLVPYLQAKSRAARPGEIADLWLTELPPRPSYVISVVFKSQVGQAVLHELVLDSSDLLLFGEVPGMGVTTRASGLDRFRQQGVSSSVQSGLVYLQSDGNGRLTMKQVILPGPRGVSRYPTMLLVWALLFSVYLLVAIPVYFLPYVVQNRSASGIQARFPNYSRGMLVLFGAVLVVVPLLAAKAGALFNEFDSFNYLYLALGGGWFSDTRLPGYPLFLSLALWLSRYHLTGVVVLQAMILVGSVVFCAWALRRWIHQFAAVVFVLLSVFSPAQIHWARWMLRESLFTSMALLGVTAAIAHFASGRPRSNAWLMGFAAICGVSLLVRENGLVMPAALLPALLPDLIKLLGAARPVAQRVRSSLLFVAPFSTPVLVLGIVYSAFAGYNYVHFGYFQIGIHQTSHAFMARAIYPGNTDARGLLYESYAANRESKAYLGRALYTSFILARDQAPGLDPIYMSLYPYVKQQMSDSGQGNNTFHLAAVINGIGKGMNTLVPQRANLAGLLRQYDAALFVRSSASYPLHVQDPRTAVSSQDVLARLPVHLTFEASAARPDGLLAAYFAATQAYSWYGAILILSVLASLYILRYDDPAFLAPMAVFAANVFLLIVTRLVDYRYLVNLDVLLILQVALGLSSWLHRRHLAGSLAPS